MINIGVVGCGYWGPKHIRVCHELAEAHMAMICDLDEKKLKNSIPVSASLPTCRICSRTMSTLW
jgi:predicted dehydrogenase